MLLQLTAAIQNGVSGLSAITRAGDPQSTGPELVLTLPLPRTGRHVLESHSKQSCHVFLRVQVSQIKSLFSSFSTYCCHVFLGITKSALLQEDLLRSERKNADLSEWKGVHGSVQVNDIQSKGVRD